MRREPRHRDSGRRWARRHPLWVGWLLSIWSSAGEGVPSSPRSGAPEGQKLLSVFGSLHLLRASIRRVGAGTPRTSAPRKSRARARHRAATEGESFQGRRTRPSGGGRPPSNNVSTGRGSHLSMTARRIACWIFNESPRSLCSHRWVVRLEAQRPSTSVRALRLSRWLNPLPESSHAKTTSNTMTRSAPNEGSSSIGRL